MGPKSQSPEARPDGAQHAHLGAPAARRRTVASWADLLVISAAVSVPAVPSPPLLANLHAQLEERIFEDLTARSFGLSSGKQ
jgi:hypothetical protein